MACVACETYAKRITNLFRDDELKDKYSELTGYQIFNDCFICDECNLKLESFYTFRHQCIAIHRKLFPSVSSAEETTYFEPDLKAESSNSDQVAISTEIYIVNEEESETLLTEDDNYTLEGDDAEKVETVYDDMYLEFEEVEEPEEAKEDDEVKPKKAYSRVQTRNVLNRKSYTVEDKLKIIKYAEDNNNRQAARNFDMNESSVRCFRRQKDVLLKMSPQKKTNRRAFPHWPKLEVELKKFVINHPIENGTKAKLKDIKKEAIEIAEKHGIVNFNGSNSYIFKFMQRHSLPSASPRPRKQRLSKIDDLSS